MFHCRLRRLRHTYGTRMAAAGTNLIAIQRIMGHASFSTTQRYVKMTDQTLYAEMEKFDV
jgi:integrase/recombinase XerC